MAYLYIYLHIFGYVYWRIYRPQLECDLFLITTRESVKMPRCKYVGGGCDVRNGKADKQVTLLFLN